MGDAAGKLIEEAGAEGIAVNLVQREDRQWQASVRHHRNSGWSVATQPDLVSAIRVALAAHRRSNADVQRRYEAAPKLGPAPEIVVPDLMDLLG